MSIQQRQPNYMHKLFLQFKFILDQSTAAIFSTSINSTVTSQHITIRVQVHIKLGVQIIDY